MVTDKPDIECRAKNRFWVSLYILFLPCMFVLWILKGYIFAGHVETVLALVVAGVVFGLYLPAAWFFGANFLSHVRIDRLGVHRDGIPLRGATIRWSNIDEIEIRTGPNATAIRVKAPGRRIGFTSKTQENVWDAEQRLLDEARMRGIPINGTNRQEGPMR